MSVLQIPFEFWYRIGVTVGAILLNIDIAQILRGIVGTAIDLDGLLGVHGVLLVNCCVGRDSRGMIVFDAHTGRVASEAQFRYRRKREDTRMENKKGRKSTTTNTSFLAN